MIIVITIVIKLTNEGLHTSVLAQVHGGRRPLPDCASAQGRSLW